MAARSSRATAAWKAGSRPSRSAALPARRRSSSKATRAALRPASRRSSVLLVTLRSATWLKPQKAAASGSTESARNVPTNLSLKLPSILPFRFPDWRPITPLGVFSAGGGRIMRPTIVRTLTVALATAGTAGAIALPTLTLGAAKPPASHMFAVPAPTSEVVIQAHRLHEPADCPSSSASATTRCTDTRHAPALVVVRAPRTSAPRCGGAPSGAGSGARPGRRPERASGPHSRTAAGARTPAAAHADSPAPAPTRAGAPSAGPWRPSRSRSSRARSRRPRRRSTSSTRRSATRKSRSTTSPCSAPIPRSRLRRRSRRPSLIPWFPSSRWSRRGRPARASRGPRE